MIYHESWTRFESILAWTLGMILAWIWHRFGAWFMDSNRVKVAWIFGGL